MDNQPSNPPELKHCPGCDKEKPVEDFGKNRSNFDGRANNCLDCARAHDRERRGPTEKEKPTDPQLETIKAAICEAREESVTPHAAELVEDLWRIFPREEFAEMWAKQLRDCGKSKSLMSRQKALDAVMKATAEHREASIGDITSLSDEDLGRALKKILNQPRLAEHTLPDEADGIATHIA